jgi:hypothetical protein
MPSTLRDQLQKAYQPTLQPQPATPARAPMAPTGASAPAGFEKVPKERIFNPKQGWNRISKRSSSTDRYIPDPMVAMLPSGAVRVNPAARGILGTTHVCVYFNPHTHQLAFQGVDEKEPDSYRLAGSKTPTASSYFTPTRLFKQTGIMPSRWQGQYQPVVEENVLIIQLPR